MKRLVSLLMTVALVLTLVACNGGDDKGAVSSETSQISSSEESLPMGNADDSSDDDVVVSSENTPSSSLPTSLEDFGNKLEESGLKAEVKENEDGSLTIGLKPSAPAEEEEETPVVVPTIPDVEDLEEPEIPEETPAESQPSESTPTQTPQKTFYTYTTNQTHTAAKNTNSYLYGILTDEQKEWYRKIDAAVNNLETEVKLGADLLENNNYNIYFLYVIDNPEHFYLSNGLGLSGTRDHLGNELYDTITIFYAVGTNDNEYSDETHDFNNTLKQKIITKKAALDAKMKEIASTIPADAPDVEKEKLIYDKILLNSVYNMDAAMHHPENGMADDWTAYGVIMNGTGVCESYDEAFQYLLRLVGIRSTGIMGKANGGDHKWCEVEIEGEWYMCDITFDDPVGGAANAAYHTYFNLTSNEMASKNNHDWSGNEYKLPNCTSTKYSYKNYFKK